MASHQTSVDFYADLAGAKSEMAENKTKAQVLMDGLGLQVERRAASGRYVSAGPGPAPGYLYWATFVGGMYQFGVQRSPKAELVGPVLAKLKNLGFLARQKNTEAFVCAGETLSSAVDCARAQMKVLTEALPVG